MREVALCVLMLTAGLAGCIGQGEELDPTATEPTDANASEEPSEPTGPVEGNTTDDAGSTSNATGAGANDTPDNPNGTTISPEPTYEKPSAVMAFIERGINPYHAAFRTDEARSYEHPSTYLDGYPEDAETLNLTFDHESLEDAIEADCEEWEQVQEETLYWVPGTRVVGLYALEGKMQASDFTCEDVGDQEPPFVAYGSHGTMVASRGAGEAYGACSECLIVSVRRGFGVESVAWTAEQPWIDIQSNSWYAGPADEFSPIGAQKVEEAASTQPSFWASLNGIRGQFGVAGDPTQIHPHFTPSVIRVGAHDSGHVTAWHGSSPHIVSDGCWSWAAEHDSMSERTPRTGGGTSASTPFAAGIAAQITLEARELLGQDATGVDDRVLAKGGAAGISSGPLQDGEFTMDELERVLFTTADPRPEQTEEDGDVCDAGSEKRPQWWALPVKWQQIPEGPAGIPLIGYGAVTPNTAEHAFEVLRGEEPMPERPNEDAYFETDRTYRETFYEAYTTPADSIADGG